MILVILLTFLCSRYVAQLILIQGRSMEPTYRNWEFALIDRRSRSFDSGDVVAVRCKSLHTTLIKRIAAVPGDKAVISSDTLTEQDSIAEGADGQYPAGTLLVNDQPSPLYPEGIFSKPGLLEQEQVLEEGCYLILGDNTEESVDSRDKQVGMIRQEDIIGKLIPQKDRASQ